MNNRNTTVVPFLLMVCLALALFPSTWAQNAPSGFSPELAPLAAKYQSEMDALAQTRDQALAQLRKPYLTALAEAEKKALREGKQDEAKAVTDEQEAVTAGNTLASVPAPLLPRALTTPRAYLLRETARVDHEYAVHAQPAAAEYLRGLSFYQSKAQAAGQTALLQQIEAEKLKLAGQGSTGSGSAHGVGHELVINGDFAQKNADNTPAGWEGGGAGRGAVTTEQGTNFLRMVSADTKETWFLEKIPRPPDAQELRVAVRLRCRDLKVQGTYGIVILQRDATEKVVARALPCVLRAPSPGWKTLSAVVPLLPETKRLVIDCDMFESVSTADFADLHVEAR